MTKDDRDMWFSRGMDDALAEKPSLYPDVDEPLAAHISYIAGRKYGLSQHLKELSGTYPVDPEC